MKRATERDIKDQGDHSNESRRKPSLSGEEKKKTTRTSSTQSFPEYLRLGGVSTSRHFERGNQPTSLTAYRQQRVKR